MQIHTQPPWEADNLVRHTHTCFCKHKGNFHCRSGWSPSCCGVYLHKTDPQARRPAVMQPPHEAGLPAHTFGCLCSAHLSQNISLGGSSRSCAAHSVYCTAHPVHPEPPLLPRRLPASCHSWEIKSLCTAHWNQWECLLCITSQAMLFIRPGLVAGIVQEIPLKLSNYTADMRKQRMGMDGEDGSFHLLEPFSWWSPNKKFCLSCCD